MTNDSFTYRYDARLAHDIEKKWQGYWADNNVFAAPNPVGDFHEPNSKLLNKPKRFVPVSYTHLTLPTICSV